MRYKQREGLMKIKKIVASIILCALYTSCMYSMGKTMARIRAITHSSRGTAEQEQEQPVPLEQVVVDEPSSSGSSGYSPEDIELVESLSKGASISDFGRFAEVAHEVLADIKKQDRRGRIVQILSQQDAGVATKTPRTRHKRSSSISVPEPGYDRSPRRHSVTFDIIKEGPTQQHPPTMMRRRSATLTKREVQQLNQMLAMRSLEADDRSRPPSPGMGSSDESDGFDRLPVCRQSVLPDTCRSGPAVMALQGALEKVVIEGAQADPLSSLREFTAMAIKGDLGAGGRRSSGVSVESDAQELSKLFGLPPEQLRAAIREMVLEREAEEQAAKAKKAQEESEQHRAQLELYRDRDKGGVVIRCTCKKVTITTIIGAVVGSAVLAYTQLTGGA